MGGAKVVVGFGAGGAGSGSGGCSIVGFRVSCVVGGASSGASTGASFVVGSGVSTGSPGELLGELLEEDVDELDVDELDVEELEGEGLDDDVFFADVQEESVVRLAAGGTSTAGFALTSAQVEVDPAKMTAAPRAATSAMFITATLPARG